MKVHPFYLSGLKAINTGAGHPPLVEFIACALH